jgi:hypothetical protein
VDEFGAPRYPELVVAASANGLSEGFRTGDELPAVEEERAICAFEDGLQGGYEALEEDPLEALDDLLEDERSLEADAQRAQLKTLTEAGAFSGKAGPATASIDPEDVRGWRSWAVPAGIVAPDGKPEDWTEAAALVGVRCSPPSG